MSLPIPIYLSHDELESLKLTTEEVVGSIERLLRARSRAQAWSAPKSVITPPDGRYIMSTLAVSQDPPLLAAKALVVNARNPGRGHPGINALLMLLDGETGHPLAVMDGNWITAVRTAGLTLVAARRLAQPDAAAAAFIGCGVQARSHLRALAAMFPLKEVRAFGRGAPNRDALCRAAESMGLKAAASPTAREAVSGADIVVSSVTLLPRPVPFLDARWLKPGAFASITDAGAPWISDSLPAFDRIVIDDNEQEAAVAQRMAPAELVAGDLAQLVDDAIPGRTSPGERAAFIFRGFALGDLALAALAWRRARNSPAGENGTVIRRAFDTTR